MRLLVPREVMMMTIFLKLIPASLYEQCLQRIMGVVCKITYPVFFLTYYTDDIKGKKTFMKCVSISICRRHILNGLDTRCNKIAHKLNFRCVDSQFYVISLLLNCCVQCVMQQFQEWTHGAM